MVFANSKDDNKFCDFLLCNAKGEVLDEYSLENVPYIFKGQRDPLVLISSGYIDNNLIQQSKLYIPFEIYLPKLESKRHKKLKISMVCEYNLQDKSLKMLNITLPESLIGKRFKSENADGKNLMIFLVHDSLLEYHFYNYGSIYLYNLKTDRSTEVYSSERFPFRNNELDDPGVPEFYSFQGFKYSPQEDMYLRHINSAESDLFKWFQIIQLFDNHFNLIGCQLFGSEKLCQLNDTNYSPFYFDEDGFLSISPTNHTGVYYHVSPGIPTCRSIEYIKQHYLVKNNDTQTSSADRKIAYNDRLLFYFNAMEIPEGSKVIMVGFDKTCVHCLEYLFGSWQRNEKAFRAQNIHYLFIGSDTAFVEQLIAGYKIPPEFVWIDEAQVYKKYFTPEERHLNPLVHYKSNTEADVIIYDFKTLDADFRRFLNLK